MPVATIRRMAPALRVGISTHTAEQAQRALADRPDYIALGPISKRSPNPILTHW